MPKKGTKRARQSQKNERQRHKGELHDRAKSILAIRMARSKNRREADSDARNALEHDHAEEKLIRALKLKQIELGLQNEELKENQQHLETARREYAALFDQAPIGYLIFDTRGIVVNANLAASALIKDDRGSILHKDFSALLPQEFRETFANHLRELFASCTRQSCELMIRGGSKAPFWAELTSTPLRDEQGEERCITLLTDITRRKKEERDLKMAWDELEDRVRERTAEVVVANQRLNLEIAQRKKKEEELRRNEAKYRELVENANSIILRVNRDGVITFANEFAESFFGYTQEELEGRHLVGSIVPPAESTGRDLKSLINHLLESPEDFAVNENENIRSDGQRVWVSWTNKVVRDESGDSAELLCIGMDISARKEMEEALKHSEARFRAIVEDQTELICRSLPNGVLTYVNEAFARYYGTTPEKLSGTAFEPDMPSGDHETVAAAISSLTPDNPVTNYEHRVIMGDGEVLWLHWVHRAIFNDQGEPVEYQRVGRRITKRKRVEEELRESRTFLRRVIDTVPNPIFVKDHLSRYVLVNKAMADLHGMAPEDMVGKDFGEFRPGHNEAGEIKEEDLTLLRTGKLLFVPQKSVAVKNGLQRHFAYTKLPLPGKQEILGVATDITERVRSEQQRIRMEKQVRHSQKMQALGTLAGGIAHDFNNMIFAILGFARLALGKSPKGGKVEEYIHQIESAGLRASELVRQILTFSRRTEQEKHPVQVGPLVKEIGKMLAATLPPSVRLELAIEDEEARILGDPTQIHQVLLNLCTNAGHAMRENGGVLSVGLGLETVTPENAEEREDLDAGDYVVISVRDTGSGMTPGVKERIFDPFFTTKGPDEGTGMGLSVVHGIVESHNGSVIVESEPGKGTEFRVYFPELKIRTDETRDAEASSPTGREHILMIDDELLVCRMLEETLGSLGYTVTAMTRPREALRRFLNDPLRYDLILTDGKMPEMTGSELAEQALAARPGIPVVLMTGHTDGLDDTAKNRELFADVLLKPLVEEELAQALRNVLDKPEE